MIFRSPTESYPWNYSGHKFELGRDPGCALPITGTLAHLVSWRHAEFELYTAEAVVRDLGSTNGTYVNGTRIQAPTRLRAGDEVWLGDGGPRLRVLGIQPDAPQRSPAPVMAEVARPTPSPPMQAPVPPPVSAPPAAPAMATDPTVQLLVEMNRSQRQTTLIIAAIVGLFLFTLLIAGGVAWWLMRASPSTIVVSNPPVKLDVPKVEPPKVDPPKTEQPKIEPPQPVPMPPPVTPPEPPVIKPPVVQPPQDPWQTAQQALAQSVYLVVVEEPKSGAIWGLANATALSDTRLLTSAVIGIELAKFQKQGRKLYALQKSLDGRTQLATILVHAAGQSDQPDQQIFFDYAILVAASPLPGKPAKLADPAEIAALEQGTSLASVAIDYGEDPIDRFQRMEPQLLANRIFAIARLADEPGAPQLARVRGKFVNKPIGCPIINQAGHVVGIYADAEQSDPNADQLQIHYMPILMPGVIELGLTGQPNQVWVTPRVPVKPAAKRK